MCVHECGRNGQMHGRSFGEQTTVTFECDYKCIAFCTVYTFRNRFEEMPSILLTQMFVLMSFSQSKFSSSFMRFASVCFTGRWIGRMGRLSWNDGYGNWFGKSADMITNRGGKTDTKSVDAQSENARQNWKIQIKISNLSTKNFWPNGDMQVSCTEFWLVWKRFVRFVCSHFSFHAQIVHRLKFAVKIFVAHDRFGWSKMPW